MERRANRPRLRFSSFCVEALTPSLKLQTIRVRNEDREDGTGCPSSLRPTADKPWRTYFLAANTGTLWVWPALAICSRSALVSGS